MGYQGQVYLYEQISATPQDTKALSAVREKALIPMHCILYSHRVQQASQKVL